MRRVLLLIFVAACSGDVSDPSALPDAATGSDNNNNVCLAQTAACMSADQCCDGLDCDTTTLGKVCCGKAGSSCATANGEDCCGDLLCIEGTCGYPESMFTAPFPCNQRWTYDHHSAEVRRALDFIRDDGGPTNNEPVLASAAGTAYRRYEGGGAGNYIVIEHGGGWTTYYFHLSAYSVPDGAVVARGQEIGRVGSTGASSGAHIHYEQLLNGVGQVIVIDGKSLAPYPAYYGEASIVSTNACP